MNQKILEILSRTANELAALTGYRIGSDNHVGFSARIEAELIKAYELGYMAGESEHV